MSFGRRVHAKFDEFLWLTSACWGKAKGNVELQYLVWCLYLISCSASITRYGCGEPTRRQQVAYLYLSLYKEYEGLLM
jgi:hypothetical protein